MSLQVFKSVIDALPFDCAQAVEDHREALLAHRFITDVARRRRMIAAVRRAEREASDAVIDAGKLRLLYLEVRPLFNRPEAQYTDAERATLQLFYVMQAQLVAIQNHSARLEAQIEDLAMEQLDSWQPVPFPS